MKCEFCGKDIEMLTNDLLICEDCIHSVDELTNGKGEDDE